MIKKTAGWLICLLTSFLAADLFAGGSGLNVLVVVNQNSTNSIQLGNYYRQMRQVPPQNYLRINWTGTNTEWAPSDFTNTLLNPLLTMLANNQLTNQIDYVVLSMDIPYRINAGANGYNGTTSALFYGFVPDPDFYDPGICGVAANSTNLFAGSESIFRQTPPQSGISNFFLATMITADDLPTAESVISNGVASDGTFPTQTTWLAKSTDVDRNVRYATFDNAIFNTRLRGNYSMMRTNMQSLANSSVVFNSEILGFENGWGAYFGIYPVPLFVPGAMADDLTSFGGRLFDYNDQPTIINFFEVGATGSYGTISEPCAYPQKFPDPQNYFYQARGFSLAECYYQSLTNGYQGLVGGEPLAAPFAKPGTSAWSGLASNSVVSGTTNLSVQFIASDAQHPLQQVDLFLDGNWLQTVTNIAPLANNVLHVSMNGYSTSYTVPASATIKSITSNLVTALNNIANETQVSAVAHGDRVQLQSTATYTRTGAQVSLAVSNTAASGPTNTFIRASATNPNNFLDTVTYGTKDYEIEVSGSLAVGATLNLSVTKTNNTVITLAVTNTTSGATLAQFTQQLITAVTNDISLEGADGLTAGDLQDGGSLVAFNLYAVGQGYAAAQIKANLTGSSGLLFYPTGNNPLTDNQDDLEPRNHLYITAGVTNLSLSIPFVTTNKPDGYHELIAVAYEGSSVHTQTRATQDFIIKNTLLSATLTASVSGTNSSLQPALQITVAANSGNINTIQIFSTGGLLAAATNLSTATFPINLTNLNIGVHPFYAIVTDKSGHQYRTATQNIGLIGVGYNGNNLIGVDCQFPLQVTGPAPILVWPATAGRSYNILSTTDLNNPFQVRTVVTPTNSLGQWSETNRAPTKQFYRVSVSP